MGHTHEDIDQAFSVISRALRGTAGRGKRELVSLNTREAFDLFLKEKVCQISSHIHMNGCS